MSNLDLTIAEIMHGDTEVLKIMKGDVEKWPNIPYDSQVEWLQSDGVAYIDTGVNAASTTTFIISLYVPAANTGYWMFGARAASNSGQLGMYRNKDFNVWDWRYHTNNVAGSSLSDVAADHIFDNTASSRRCKVDGTDVTSNAATFSNNYSIYICAMNTAGTASGVLSGLRINYAKFYSSGTLVRDFIPVRKNSVGYLFDKVNKVLYGNAEGSGAFTYGNDV